VRREQGLGFTHEWEKVVGPVIDYLETLPSVDMQRVALMGYSMGGVLAARAAALDHRVKALLQIDGLYDFADSPISKAAGSTFGNLDDVEATRVACGNLRIPAGLRWALSHGLWSFKVQTRTEFVAKVKKFTVRGLEDKIECPVFVGNPEHDMFFAGQPEKMKDVLGDKSTLVTLTNEDAAGFHCHISAQRFVNAVMWEWFEEKVVNKA
jgi:pimeloyl-ACP methyl ester carboxylesterase